MDGTISILNETYQVEDASELEIKQLENGDWEITVDGTVTHQGEFAPSRIEIGDDK